MVTCIVSKPVLFVFTMVSEDDLSHLEVQHLESRPIYVFATFYPANGPCSTAYPYITEENIFLSTYNGKSCQELKGILQYL